MQEAEHGIRQDKTLILELEALFPRQNPFVQMFLSTITQPGLGLNTWSPIWIINPAKKPFKAWRCFMQNSAVKSHVKQAAWGKGNLLVENIPVLKPCPGIVIPDEDLPPAPKLLHRGWSISDVVCVSLKGYLECRNGLWLDLSALASFKEALKNPQETPECCYWDHTTR